MTLPIAYILDTAQREDVKPILHVEQSRGGPVRHSRTVVPGVTYEVRRQWVAARPGELRFLWQHYEETGGSAFTIGLQNGAVVAAIYKAPPEIRSGKSGFGTATVTLETVRSWD